MNWNEFFKTRTTRNRFQLGFGLLSGFISFQSSAFYLLTQKKFDPTYQLIPDVDMTVVYIGGVLLAGIGGFIGGNLIANPIFRLIKPKEFLQVFDQKERNLSKRIRLNRAADLSKVGVEANTGHLDYFGEKIHSVKDYRKWLIIQRDFKKTGKLPHRLFN
jgi:hypothetical protein